MTDTPKDPQARLRDLANKWALRARDYARDSKAPNADPDRAAYARGLAEGFYKAATELADLLKGIPAEAFRAPSAPPPAPPAYLKVTLNEALDVLTFAGTAPREVTPRPDNTFQAIFSKWENIQPHERVEQIKKADMRLVIVETGKTKDGQDPFVVFGFKTK